MDLLPIQIPQRFAGRRSPPNGAPITVSRTTTLVANIPRASYVLSVTPATKKTATTKSAAKTTATTKATGKTTTTKVALTPAQITEKARSAAVLLPGLAPGFAATSATTQAYARWLFPGGEVDPQDSAVITVTNPSNSPVHVSVDLVASQSALPQIVVGALPRLMTFTLGPNQTTSVALNARSSP